MRRENGSAIIESLISIAILAIVLASTSRLIAYSVHANTASRTFASLSSEVAGLFDNYKAQPYDNLLAKFGGTYTAIASGQTATETVSSKESHATFTVTFTAIKTNSNSRPEAIRVRVSALHRRGRLGNATFPFETIITGAT